MIGRILKVLATNNSQITAEVKITEDDGTLIFEGTRGFVSLAKSDKDALDYLKQAMKNIANQIKAEKASKLKSEAQKNIDKDISLTTSAV